MHIVLDAKAEELIEEKLKAGNYSTPSELVRAAIDALSKQEEYRTALAQAREKVAAGIDAADRGELSDGDDFFAVLESEDDLTKDDRKTA